VFNEALTETLAQACDGLGISYQYKDEYIDMQNARLRREGKPEKSFGSTEMGRIIAASGGLVDGTTLQIPTIGYHTMDESASMVACDAFLQVLKRLAGLHSQGADCA